jgi:nitrogen fixation/metabolism regulation signal transduction histidine kinase
MSETPRTDEFQKMEHVASDWMWREHAKQLERELAEVTKQRDELQRIALRMSEIFDESGDEIMSKQFRQAIRNIMKNPIEDIADRDEHYDNESSTIAEVTKQRDALVEVGRMCLDTMNTSSISRMSPAKNAMTAALAAVKGGSNDS